MLLLLPLAATFADPTGTATRGPSSSQPPYLVPADVPGVEIVSVLTVGDSVNDKTGPESDYPWYRLVGTPDGLGAYDNGDGTFTLLVNHEIGDDQGIARAHNSGSLGAGATPGGAFVSRWIIRTSDFKVLHGEDLSLRVMVAGPDGMRPDPACRFSRLCSADLAAPSAWFHGSAGTRERLFLDGEEHVEGRAFAHVATGPDAGTSVQLVRLGRMSFENVVACPYPSGLTLVACLDDASLTTDPAQVVCGDDSTYPSEVYFYCGAKLRRGSPVERAGLANGKLYGLVVAGAQAEDRAAGLAGGKFTLRPMGRGGDVTGMSGWDLQTESLAFGVTRFLRVEDGSWDPVNPHLFYFATTDRVGGNTRVWRLRFHDLALPEEGGTIEVALNGPDVLDADGRPAAMWDNLAVTSRGSLVVQEDPGNAELLARIWWHDADGTRVLARHDPELFGKDGARLLTTNEESSGIIDIGHFKPGWLLASVQAHYELDDPELIEGGQIVAIHVPR